MLNVGRQTPVQPSMPVDTQTASAANLQALRARHICGTPAVVGEPGEKGGNANFASSTSSANSSHLRTWFLKRVAGDPWPCRPIILQIN